MPTGQTLLIEAGVQVVFYGNFTLEVAGTLTTSGTATQPVIISSASTGTGFLSWAGIRLLENSGNHLLTHTTISQVAQTDPTINGGAIYANGPQLTIQNCLIENNTTASNGGGIFLEMNAGQSALIANTIIRNNEAALRGGGIAIAPANGVIIQNCLLYGNEATGTNGSAGGGIHITGPGNPLISNCTVSRNQGSPDAGISAHANTQPDLRNCILWGNSGTDLSEFPANGGIPSVTNCNVSIGPTNGNGNLSVTPYFIDAPNGNFHLLPNSQCIDSGTSTAAPFVDLQDNPRPFGGAHDIGCYEHGYFDVELFPQSIGCSNECNGEIALIIPWADPPYDIEWSAGNNNQDTINNLCVGDYSVTVTSANGQVSTESISLGHQYNPPQVSFTVNQSTQCLIGNQFEFTNNSTLECGEMSHWWYFGGVSTSQEFSPEQIYTVTGNFGISYAPITNTGCTNVATTTVTVVDAQIDTLNLAPQDENGAFYQGQVLPVGSTTPFPYVSTTGCDSVVVVVVGDFIINLIVTDTIFTTCGTTPIVFESINLFPETTDTFSYVTNGGADSLLIVSVVSLPEPQKDTTVFSCGNSPFIFNGTPIPVNTTDNFTFLASNGCDSTVNISIVSLPIFESNDTITTCQNTPIDYLGEMLLPNSTTDISLTAQNGCDSIVSVFVQEILSITSNDTIQTCENTPIDYLGEMLLPNSTTDIPLSATNGCDSIVTVYVEEIIVPNGVDTVSTCSDTTVNYNGESLPINMTTDIILQSSTGCDSIVAVMVVQMPLIETTETVFTCFETPYSYLNQNLLPNSINDFIFISENGCDTMLTVFVEEREPLLFDIGNNQVISSGDLAPLNLDITWMDEYSIVWTPADKLSCNFCPDPLWVGLESDEVSATITDELGCNSSDVFFMTVEAVEDFVHFPTAFSPNKDGINDVFLPLYQGNFDFYHLSIFDRWGNEVFEQKSPNLGWDGFDKASPAPIGVYAFQLDYALKDGSRQVLRGNLTLVR